MRVMFGVTAIRLYECIIARLLLQSHENQPFLAIRDLASRLVNCFAPSGNCRLGRLLLPLYFCLHPAGKLATLVRHRRCRDGTLHPSSWRLV